MGKDISNGNGDIVTVVRRGELPRPEGVVLAINKQPYSYNSSAESYTSIFIPRDRVGSIIAALEDEAGV